MKINLIEYFKETVLAYPEKIAIIKGDKSIRFNELDNKAKIIAKHIIMACGDLNVPVGVFIPKSIDAVLSDIAVSYSGNIYMNLDVNTPLERIKSILNNIQPRVIITNSAQKSNIESIVSSDTVVINLDQIDFSTENEYTLLTKRLESLIDTDPLCIINTSGSTGTPKGVVLNHKSYIDYTQWAIGRFHLNSEEILGVLSPILFDHYNFEISLMMSVGCTLVLLDNNLAAFPVKILEEVVKQDVSFIFWVPAIMVNIANMDLLNTIPLPKVKMVWFAGEVFPTKQFNIWRKHLAHATFVNLYGPVETTVDCTYYEVIRELADDEPVPIGFPCRNTSVLILDENNALCEVGVEGELCVRGTSLAMGYYNNSEKTDLVFTQNPLNTNYPELIYRTGDIVVMNNLGEIVFKGRRDSLIKHLGYRIELGEIEHIIINTLKFVPNGCAVYNQQAKEICFIYESDSEISSAEFRKSIGQALPKYMIPTNYIHIEKLPVNTNGKIDRLSLTKSING
jgi:amino acid adenylation domain-containing protein